MSGSMPETRHTVTPTRPFGVLNHSGLSPLVAAFMNRPHSGTAMSPA